MSELVPVGYPTIPDLTDPNFGGANQRNLDDLRRLLGSVSAQTGIAAGTTLPSSPANGQDYYYVADGTNGVVWHLKYRSASASSYKWEFVGGPPMLVRVATNETTSSATYAALATAGPSVTVPLAGDYGVAIGATAGNTSDLQEAWMSFDIGGSGAVDADAAKYYAYGTSGKQVSVAVEHLKTGLAASTALVSKYRVGGGTGSWSARWIRVVPVRVG